MSAIPASFLPYWEKVSSSSLGYRFARGAFWSLLGSVTARGLNFLAGVAVARILGRHDFGQFGMIQSTIGMFGVLAGFGMGLTATKHVAEYRFADPAKAGRIIGLSNAIAWISGGIMTALLLVWAPWLAVHTLASPAMAELLRAGALLLILGGVNGAQTGALSGFEAFKTIARINLWMGLASFPITLAFAWSMGVLGAVWASVVCLALNCLWNGIALREVARRGNIPISYGNMRQEWSVFWHFSLPAVCTGLIYTPSTWFANMILVHQPSGYEHLGVLNAVYRIRQLPETILSMVLAPLLPALAEHFGRKDIKSYNRTLSLGFIISALIIIPVALLQTAWPTLSLLPFGREYLGHESLVRVVMLQSVLTGLSYPFGSVLASTNRMWFGFIYNLGYSLLLIALSWWLVPTHKAVGLALATTMTNCVSTIICLVYIRIREKGFIVGTPIIHYGILVLFFYGLCFAASLSGNQFLGIACGVFTGSAFCVLLIVQFVRRHARSNAEPVGHGPGLSG